MAAKDKNKTDRSFLKTGATPPKGLKKAGFRAAEGEICYGCGAIINPPPHPDLPATSVVGILHVEDFEDGWTKIDHPTGEAGEDGQKYVAVPVCIACHKDPAHRSAHPLKVHFFERRGNGPKIALLMAGSFNIQG
jgi:hypothetical protein